MRADTEQKRLAYQAMRDKRRSRKQRANADACRYCGKPPDVEWGDEWIWMCPECDQIRQYLIEIHPEWNRGSLSARVKKIVQDRNRIENLEWMLAAGETDSNVLAKRIEYSHVSGLDKLLERTERRDLSMRISWRAPTSHAGLERSA